MRTRLLLTLLLTATATSAGQVELSVDWAGVNDGPAFPVTGGVALPRGALRSADAVRLTGGGKALPLQTEVLALWPDRSVKWLLLDFQARPGRKAFVLHYGEGVTGVPVPAPLTATTEGGAAIVDTGVLRFAVRRDGCGFIDELLYRGDPICGADGRRRNVMDFTHVADPADVPPGTRWARNGKPDPSTVVVDSVTVENAGPLRAVVRIDGKYRTKLVGSTIEGTTVKGDCPFRVRLTAYAGQSLLRVEHTFVYEGDGDHDFVSALSLRLGLPRNAGAARLIGERSITPPGPLVGLVQQSADAFAVWTSEGRSARVVDRGGRFEGVLDVTAGKAGIAIAIKDMWQMAPKSLHADLRAGELSINLWAPEAAPLDFRRHAREWSVGETGTPDDPKGTRPALFKRPRYRLASKGVSRTHRALIHCHDASASDADIVRAYRLFQHRPLLWASPQHYASTRALGHYHAPKGRDDVEAILASGIDVWKASQKSQRWYGFWLYGNVCQNINNFFQHGRWSREFGRWGWSNGDSVGRLGYALMLQAVRRCERSDFEFGEAYLHNIHDVCSTHTPAYPHHYGQFIYLKGASHRHGAWPWACPYVGIRGAHPMGAKIYYYLTGEPHARDILDELTQLALRNPNGGEGDGPLGPNALIHLYQWEVTGDPVWRDRLKKALDSSDLLRKADSGWLCMMSAAFGIFNALEEYMDLTGDDSMKALAAGFADRCMPEKYKRHWTWGGYFRVYALAHRLTGDPKYRRAIEEMLDVLREKTRNSLAFRVPRDVWPGSGGGPKPFIDANIIRDVPFALHALTSPQTDPEGK